MSRIPTTPVIPTRRAALASLFTAIAAAGIVPAAASALSGPIAAPVPSTGTPLSALPVSVAAQPNPDAELLRLVDDYFAAMAEEKRLGELHEPHERKFFEQRAKRWQQVPGALRVRPEDLDLGIPPAAATADGVYQPSEMVHLRSDKWVMSGEVRREGDTITLTTRTAVPSEAARARADEIVAAFDKWTKWCERRSREDRAAKRAYDAATAVTCKLENRIAKMPAMSLAGIIAKTKMGKDAYPDADYEPDFVGALIADLLALDADSGRALS
jgi:hypothetical protein